MAPTESIETVAIRCVRETAQQAELVVETPLKTLALNPEEKTGIFQRVNLELNRRGYQALTNKIQYELLALFGEGTLADFGFRVLEYATSAPTGDINSPGAGDRYKCPNGDYFWKPAYKGMEPPPCPNDGSALIRD